MKNKFDVKIGDYVIIRDIIHGAVVSEGFVEKIIELRGDTGITTTGCYVQIEGHTPFNDNIYYFNNIQYLDEVIPSELINTKLGKLLYGTKKRKQSSSHKLLE